MDGWFSVGADLLEYYDLFHDDLRDGIFISVLSLAVGERRRLTRNDEGRGREANCEITGVD